MLIRRPVIQRIICIQILRYILFPLRIQPSCHSGPEFRDETNDLNFLSTCTYSRDEAHLMEDVMSMSSRCARNTKNAVTGFMFEDNRINVASQNHCHIFLYKFRFDIYEYIHIENSPLCNKFFVN